MIMWLREFACLLRVQFKRMLSRELTHVAESGKVGTQISEYICHTFLGKPHLSRQTTNVIDRSINQSEIFT